MLRPNNAEKKIRTKKRQDQNLFFIIGCMSHPEKATSSCYLGNYQFLRLDNEDKSCSESKIN